MATVYSTDKGRLCPNCSQSLDQCECKAEKNYKSENFIRVSRETKGRKGKGVSLITGIGGSETEIKKLAKILKKKCNSGGSVKEGVIEIQGDHREKLKIELEKLGYTVKLAGG